MWRNTAGFYRLSEYSLFLDVYFLQALILTTSSFPTSPYKALQSIGRHSGLFPSSRNKPLRNTQNLNIPSKNLAINLLEPQLRQFNFIVFCKQSDFMGLPLVVTYDIKNIVVRDQLNLSCYRPLLWHLQKLVAVVCL